MTTELSAITLTEPFATLSVAPLLRSRMASSPAEHDKFVDCQPGQPLKQHETRGYRLSGTPRRLVIHAGKSAGGMRETITNYRNFDSPYAEALCACGYSSLDPWQSNYLAIASSFNEGKALRLGYMLGLVTVTKMVATGVGQPAHDWDGELGNWNPRRWAWKMEEPFMLATPIPARGYQSLWKVLDYQQAALREQGATW